MILTVPIASKWYQLGWALEVPINELERLYDKYHDKPGKALARIYCHWLADDSGMSPTCTVEVKLIEALRKIREHNLAVTLERNLVCLKFWITNHI